MSDDPHAPQPTPPGIWGVVIGTGIALLMWAGIVLIAWKVTYA